MEISARITNNQIVLDCPWEHKDIVSKIGARWSKSLRKWYFPHTTWTVLKSLKEKNIFIDKDVSKLYLDFKIKEDNISKIKDAKPRDLPTFQTHKDLYEHQRKTLFFGYKRGSYADLSDCGTGKTISTLSVINEHIIDDEHFTTLVLAPKSIILSGWVADGKKMYPHLKIIPVVGSKKQKIEAFGTPAQIYVTNYETMNQGFDFSDSNLSMLVCDEAVRLKNPQAKWTKAVKKISRDIEYKVILSGLISPNSLFEVFAPFDIIEPHILCKSYYQFRDRYFVPNPFSFQNREWCAKPNSEKAIMNKLERLIIRNEKSECVDLPEKIHTVREIPLKDEQKKAYKTMEKEFYADLDGGRITAMNSGVKIQKLQQITSGFLYNDNGANWFNSAKISDLDAMLTGELAREQVIVFCTYRGEVDKFKELYPNSSFIYGGQNTDEQELAIENFKNGTNRLLFANVKASKYGLTFTNCSTVIYYSMSYSLDDIYQSQERIHRIGQTKTCNYIYMLSEKTIDKKIYNAIVKKQTLNDMIYELIKERGTE